jgi:DNA-binding transcriptional LysR family regulator
MELRDLRYFLAVVDEGSLPAAAKSLRMSPSTLSRRTRKLERELKTRLFLRRRGSITLTVAGKIMRSHARNILKYVAVATDAVGVAEKSG